MVIPGCKTPGQLRENFGTSDAPMLSAGQIERIHAIHAELLKQFGRIHPYAMEAALGLE